jgi:predicted transcriptional regulator
VVVLTGALIRAARALLGISVKDLTAATGVAEATIRRAEATSGSLKMTVANQRRLVDAFDARGVLFLDCADGGGAGVRFKSSVRDG